MTTKSKSASTLLRHAIRRTRLAPVLAVVDEQRRVVRLRFLDPDAPDADAERVLAPLRRAGCELLADARACAGLLRQVDEFVRGRRTDLEVVLAPQGTPFQQRVWKELGRVPYGATLSYGELARRIGRPTAVRATARANATNPVALAVPCHRVVGKDGAVTGYNGGIAVKTALLAMERRRRGG